VAKIDAVSSANLLVDSTLALSVFAVMNSVGIELFDPQADEIDFCTIDQGSMLLKSAPVVWLIYIIWQFVRFLLFTSA
jgi:hypothetical protein